MKVSAICTVLTAIAAGLPPVPSYAHALDRQLDCKSNAHAFIAPLLKNEYIDPNPMRVEANSVNAFRPSHGSDMTAFGFRVYAVIGYEQDDGLFKKGAGQALAGPLYGAVLSAPSEAVESRVLEAGSNANVRMVIPMLLTAVVCSPS